MDDFFKSLKQNLESRENPQFNPGAWERMQKKMQNARDSNSSANKSWLYYLLGLFLLVSLGVNYYLYHNLSGKNVTTLDKITFTEHFTDTIYKDRIIHHTDTIFKIKNDDSADRQFLRLLEIPLFDPREIVQDPYVIDDSHLDRLSVIPTSDQNLKREYRKDIRKGMDTFRVPPIQALTQDLRNEIPFFHSNFSQLDRLHSTNVNVVQQEATLLMRSDPIRSQGFLIGLHGGPITVVDSKIEPSIGRHGGLQVLWKFRERWRLTAAVDYNQISFETELPEGFPDIPIIAAPSDNFELDEIDIEDQRSLQVGLGVQYLFDIEDKLQPFVGLGWNLSRFIDDSQVYEFKNLADLDEIEIVAPKNQYAGIYHYLFGSIGMEYTLLPLWRLQVCASYRYRLRGDQDLMAPSLIGLRLGILKNF